LGPPFSTTKKVKSHMTSRRKLISRGIGLMAATAVTRSFVAQSGVRQPKFVASPVDPIQLVNPQFRAFLQSIAGPDSAPTEWTTAMLPQIREGSKGLARPLLPAPAVVKRMIPGPKGAPDVPLYITGATAGAPKPAVLHIHGGGYIAGSAADSRRDIQELAANHNCVAISVDYRLAPETPFPGSLEDNYVALLWMYSNAAELGIDRRRIAIKGESAGGGHAAALAIAARDRGEVPLCLQVLIYPMLDDRTGSTMPGPPYIGHYIWTAASNRFGWTSLLGKPAGSAQPPAGSVPALIENLAGLPPAWIGVGSVDLFANEDVEYARRLLQAGVSTELHIVPGGYHGFDILVPQAPLSVAFAGGWNAALSRAFAALT
jgi:acetyl esterase/lipase